MANKRQESRTERKSRTSVFERLGSKSKNNSDCNENIMTSTSRRDCKKIRTSNSAVKHLDIKNLESQDDDYLQKKREEIRRELDLQSKTKFKHKKTMTAARKSKPPRSSSSSSSSSAGSMASNSESNVSDDKSSSKSSIESRPKKANRLKLKARKIVKSVKNKSKGITNRSSTLSSSASSSATSSLSTSTSSTASSVSSSSPSSLSNSSSNSSDKKSKFTPKTSKSIIKTSDSHRVDRNRANSSKIVAVSSTTSSTFPKSRISRIEEDYHSNTRKRISNERRMDFRSRSPLIQRQENRSVVGNSRAERQWNRSPIKVHRVPDDDHFLRRSLSKSDRRSGGNYGSNSNYVPRSKSRTSKDDEDWQRKLSVIERNLAINRMQEKLRNDTNLTREEREMLLEKERRAALARAQQRQKERERLAKFQQLSEKNIQFNRMLRKGEFKRRSLDRNDVPKIRGEQSRSISNETHQKTIDRDRTQKHNDMDRKRDRSIREREDSGIKEFNRDKDYAKDRNRDNDQVGNQFKRECSDERRTSKFSRRNWSDRNYSEEEEEEDDDDDTYSRSAMVASRAQSAGERQEEGRCDNNQSVTGIVGISSGSGGGDSLEAETIETDHESNSSRRSFACKKRTLSQISVFSNEKKHPMDLPKGCISDNSSTAKNRNDIANVTKSNELSDDNDDDFDEKSDEWSETDNLRIEEEWDKFEQLDSNKNGSDEIFRTDLSFEALKEQNNSDQNESEILKLNESNTQNDDNLSEISDEIDDILNRDEQQQRPQSISDDKNQPNKIKKTSIQNVCHRNQSNKVENSEISIDFEHISDSELSEDRKTATDLSMDWSSLRKTSGNSETTKNEKIPPLWSSVKQKWTFDEIIKKTGVSSRLLNIKNKEITDCGVDSKLQRQLTEQNGSLAANEALKHFKRELRSRLIYDPKTVVPQLAISAKRDLFMRQFLFDSSIIAFDRQQCILINTDKFHNLAVHNFQKHIDPKPLF